MKEGSFLQRETSIDEQGGEATGGKDQEELVKKAGMSPPRPAGMPIRGAGS